jgi:acetyl esterase/lipase
MRKVMDKSSASTNHALEKHVPAGITSVLDEQYRLNDKDAFLDIYYPTNIKDSNQSLPTVVWIHGGAFVSGDKVHIANYAKILASYNYTVVSVGYSIAPEQSYPTPIFQVNDALAYLDKNAFRLHIDSNRYFIAGDSAGAHIAAQVGAITTNPNYADELRIKPALAPNQIRGLLLNCGVYNASVSDYNGPAGKFLNPVLEAYTGRKDFLNAEAFKTLSVINYVTKDFPQSFITVGNGDSLQGQSVEFNDKLSSLGVKTVTLFYAQNHEPSLPHEYQFNLDIPDGQKALTQIIAFLSSSGKA